MIPIAILTEEDVLLETDFVRYMAVEYDGQSDHFQTTNCYGGGPLNYFKWLNLVDAGFLHYIGKPLGAYLKVTKDKGWAPLEFARGPIPESHQLRISECHSEAIQIRRDIWKKLKGRKS